MTADAPPGGRGLKPFAEALSGILRRTDGALAAAVVASDGMVVHAEGNTGSPDLSLLTAHCSDLLRRSSSAGEECGLGATAELIQKTGSNALLVRAVNDQYCLMLLLDTGGLVGRGRWELRKAAGSLRMELE